MSYVFSSLTGNYEGLFRNDNGQSDPNITSLFDLQSLLDNTYGRLPNDRPHQFKFNGSYQTPFKLMLSANFYAQSGIVFNQLIPHPIYGNNEGFAGHPRNRDHSICANSAGGIKSWHEPLRLSPGTSTWVRTIRSRSVKARSSASPRTGSTLPTPSVRLHWTTLTASTVVHRVLLRSLTHSGEAVRSSSILRPFALVLNSGSSTDNSTLNTLDQGEAIPPDFFSFGWVFHI